MDRLSQENIPAIMTRGWILSMHDPEMRHGHKAAAVVDTDTQLITAVDVLPGNVPRPSERVGDRGAERGQRRRAG